MAETECGTAGTIVTSPDAVCSVGLPAPSTAAGVLLDAKNRIRFKERSLLALRMRSRYALRPTFTYGYAVPLTIAVSM